MKIKISDLISIKEWDDFVIANNANFLQSISWGEFKKKYQKVYRIEIREKNCIVGVCQFFEEKLPIGNYFYIPFGPVANNDEITEIIIDEVIKKAKRKNILFVKIEPFSALNRGVQSYHRIQPQKTTFLDIKEDEQNIFSKFKKNTRYSIRQAQKKDVSIKQEGSIEDFYNLLKKTQKRQIFNSYSHQYFKELAKNNNIDVFYAQYNSKIIASSIILYFGKTATYLHSAFDYNYAHANATALIVFESIKIAKQKNCNYYDFWGLNKKKFPGVTKFKQGFSGKEIIYLSTKDIVIKKIPYFIYYIASIIKNKQ